MLLSFVMLSVWAQAFYLFVYNTVSSAAKGHKVNQCTLCSLSTSDSYGQQSNSIIFKATKEKNVLVFMLEWNSIISTMCLVDCTFTGETPSCFALCMLCTKRDLAQGGVCGMLISKKSTEVKLEGSLILSILRQPAKGWCRRTLVLPFAARPSFFFSYSVCIYLSLLKQPTFLLCIPKYL